MEILDGKSTAQKIKEELKQQVERLLEKGERPPHLVTVLVGHDGGSETYVKNKSKACAVCGFKSTVVRYEADITEAELLSTVDKLNRDENVDGFIVQLPLPAHISSDKVLERIDYRKDVDGFHPINVGRLFAGLPCFVSATPQGIFTLLQRYEINTSGKHCVILGRSNIVGKPLAALMMQKQLGDATVTICHSHTPNIGDICRSADILIAAMGQPHFVQPHMVKEGAVVVDVGTTRIADSLRPKGFRLAGDVDFQKVAPKCSYISPVPGGVGPMTICMLMCNTMAAYLHTVYPE